jgi:hypothetical protein
MEKPKAGTADLEASGYIQHPATLKNIQVNNTYGKQKNKKTLV